MENPSSDRACAEADALYLAVLGPPLVRWGAQAVAFRTRKEFALLAYLALRGTPQPREHLATLFWPDHDEAAARKMVRATLSRLRHNLAVAGGAPVAALTLLHSGRDALGREVVALTRTGIPTLTLDVEALEAATTSLSVAAATRRVEEAGGAEGVGEARLADALAAYRGPFLEGVRFDDAPELEAWVDAQRAYWQGQIERVLGRLTALHLERHALDDAAALARRWLALDALSEPAYRVLMRALAGSGDRAGALAVYAECRRALREQLGVDAAPETVALAERLRRLPGGLAAARPAGPPLATPADAAGGLGTAPSVVELPFVGREREFAALVAAYQTARAGRLQLVILEGEAGSGKTRLVEEFLRWAALEGADVLHSRGDETRGAVPYQLLVDALRPRLARERAPDDLLADVWLSELVRLFPELHERYPDLPPAATLPDDAAGGPGRLFEALQQLLLVLAERARPGALVVCYDDAQWSDQAMRDLLLYRLRRQREAGAPQLLLLVVQTEALAGAPELEHWLGRLARLAPTARLRLGPLAEEETAQALASVLAAPPPAADADEGERMPPLGPWLHAQAEGHPFYLVELLRALVGRGILVPAPRDHDRDRAEQSATGAEPGPRLALAPGVDDLPHLVPAGVHDLIRGQLDGLSSPALEVLAAAAVLGRDASFEHLCRVAELDERAGLAALDELARHGLLIEMGEPPRAPADVSAPVAATEAEAGTAAYRFAHGLVREVVYTEAGEARRRLFHRRALALLEGRATPATLAQHAQAAGLTMPAVQALVAAGDAALAVSAVRDADAHYEQARRLLGGPDAAGPPSRQVWGDTPTVPMLQGRAEELATLAGWVRDERCRVVQVLGAGGVGKTALAARLAHDLAPAFEVVCWRSLRNAPPPQEWLAGAIAALSAGQAVAPEGLEAQLRLLLGLLRARRGLLVLDNLETVLEPGTPAVRYRAGYEGYGEVLAYVAASTHQGCVLLTSREQPLRADEPAVRALHLAGLGVADGQALLERWRLAGDAAAWTALVGRYGGNPLALQVVGETIAAVFGGEIGAFLAQEAGVFGGIRQLLDEQVARLSPLEQAVLTWLAVEREPAGFGELAADLDLGPGMARAALLEAMEGLRRRSLLETGGRGKITLQPVVLEYATAQLVARIGQEILQSQPSLLLSHALVKAQSKDYVRRSQEWLIVQPLLEQLVSQSGGAAAVEQRLRDLLERWRGRPPQEQGYGPGNVLNLVRLLRGDVRGLDFSRLSIRQAYLAGVEAQDASLAGAHLAEAVLAEAFDYPVSVALSADGALLAAGTSTGEVRLWRVSDRTPLLSLQGHSGLVLGVALSGDGQVVASGGQDGTVRLWAASPAGGSPGRPLATLDGHSGGVRAVSLNVDGRLVASAGDDGLVKLWRVAGGRLATTLRGHRGAIWGLELSADGRLLTSAGDDGTIRLWEAAPAHPEDDQVAGRPLATLQGPMGGLWDVALSGEGRLVAGASDDGTITLWEVPPASGTSVRLWTTIEGNNGGVRDVALSADGQLVASANFDGTVKLWDTQSGRLLRTLQGHGAAVWGVALGCDGRLVASSSRDGTVRLWDRESGRPLRILQGHAAAVRGVALSGDGRLVVSASSDSMVKLWDTQSGRLLRTLQGHGAPVWGVAVARDGQVVASVSQDSTLKLWDTQSGRLLRTLQGHGAPVWAVALSEDGRLIASGSEDGTVRLWEIGDGQLVATLQGHSGTVSAVALSGDGRLVASGSFDGTVTLWAAPSGRPLATLKDPGGGVWGVALSRDGRLVAGGSFDGTVTLWAAPSGACLRTLRGERRYERLDIAGLTGVTQAQRAALLALGAVE